MHPRVKRHPLPLLVPLAAALVVVGCWTDEDPIVDAGIAATEPDRGVAAEGGQPDRGLAPDGGPAPDAAGDAAADTGGDAGPAGCSATADVAPFELAASHCVADRFELSAQAMALRGGAVWTFNATGAKSFAVQTQAFSLGAGLAGAPQVVVDFTVAEEGTFGSEFLALSPAAEVAVGYNTADFTNPQGAVFWGAAGQTPAETEADGNYDAAFLDADTLLVNGMGAGGLSGQALYVLERGQPPRKLINALGDNSGAILVGASAVFAAGFYADAGASGASRVFAFSLAEVKAALAAKAKLNANADGDEVFTGGFLDAATQGDDLLLSTYDATTFQFSAVKRVAVTVAGDGVTAGAATELITAPAGATGSVARLAVDGALIGALIADDAGKSTLALIREK